MSATNSIGDFDLNLVTLRKPLEFANGTIQSTAYTGAGGVPTLTEVLTAGSSASGQNISGVGTLTTSSLDVTSSATFNGDIIQSNSESNNIVQQNITTDGNQNILRTTDMFGTLRLKRPTSANGGDLLLYDVTGSSADFTQLYLGGSAFAFKNLAKGGKIGFTLQDNNNVELDPLTLTQSSNQARVGINKTNPACTLDVSGITSITSVSSSLGTDTFSINDTGSSGGTKGMLFYPNATAGTFNPLQQNGDSWIVATTGLGVNTANLTINTWATEKNGMRITDLTTSIYGGNNDYIKIDGSIDTTETFGTNLNVNQTNVTFTSPNSITLNTPIRVSTFTNPTANNQIGFTFSTVATQLIATGTVSFGKWISDGTLTFPQQGLYLVTVSYEVSQPSSTLVSYGFGYALNNGLDYSPNFVNNTYFNQYTSWINLYTNQANFNNFSFIHSTANGTTIYPVFSYISNSGSPTLTFNTTCVVTRLA